MSATEGQSYRHEEAEEILRIAARDGLESSGMTRERLLSIASEVGISPEAVARAEEEIARKRSVEAQDKLDEHLFADYKRYRRQKLFGGVGQWLSTSILLLGINFLTSRTISWALWPVGIWGLVELTQVVERLFTPARRDEKFERWKAKRTKREERRREEAS